LIPKEVPYFSGGLEAIPQFNDCACVALPLAFLAFLRILVTTPISVSVLSIRLEEKSVSSWMAMNEIFSGVGNQWFIDQRFGSL
jgi:hypothetical protein